MRLALSLTAFCAHCPQRAVATPQPPLPVAVTCRKLRVRRWHRRSARRRSSSIRPASTLESSSSGAGDSTRALAAALAAAFRAVGRPRVLGPGAAAHLPLLALAASHPRSAPAPQHRHVAPLHAAVGTDGGAAPSGAGLPAAPRMHLRRMRLRSCSTHSVRALTSLPLSTSLPTPTARQQRPP